MEELTKLLEAIIYEGMERLGRHYSMYRGIVTDPTTDENGTIGVYIPHLTGEVVIEKRAKSKGMINTGGNGTKVLPKKGEIVWVEFEFGDSEFPVWTWGPITSGQPALTKNPETHKYSFRTPGGNEVWIDDELNSIRAQTANGTYIELAQTPTEESVDGIMLKTAAGIISIENSGTKDSEGNDQGPTVRVAMTDGAEIELLDGVIYLNGNENLGLVKIKELTEKLNNIEKAFNSLLSSFNSHTHTATGATAPTKNPDIPCSQTELIETQIEDMENGTVVH